MLSRRKRRADGTFDGVYVDCTFGRGGHCREILSRLSPQGRLYAFDVDPEAVAAARVLEAQDPRFKIIHRPFGDLAEAFPEPGSLDGVLVDLGVSSPQLDDRHRGFNIQDDAPPDMRMNQSTGTTAQEWLHGVTAEELAWVIHAYGEDDDSILSERIAEHILARQREDGGAIRSNRCLANVVKRAKAGFDEVMHPAKLTFQAIRVFLNQEMQQLDRLLEGALDRLALGGHFAVITFKKKEANAVRKFVREHEDPDPYLAQVLPRGRLCELYPLLLTQKDFSVEQLGGAIKVSSEEVMRNWRSRSSAVHLLRKLPRSSYIHLDRALVRPIEERFQEPRMRPAFVGGAATVVTDLRSSPPQRPCEPAYAAAPAPRSPAAEPAPEPVVAAAHAAAGVPARPGSAAAAASTAAVSGAQEAKAEDEDGLVVQITARVVEDYTVNVSTYVSLRRGSTVTVHYRGTTGEEAGWSYGVADGIAGWFPSSCVEPLTPDEAG